MGSPAGIRQVVALSPLTNFLHKSSAPITLSPGLTLRRVTDSDRASEDPESIFQLLSQAIPPLPAGVSGLWALTLEYEVGEAHNGYLPELVLERLSRVLDAMHLLKDDMVGIPFAAFGEGAPLRFHSGVQVSDYPPSQAWQRAVGRPYMANTTELRAISLLAVELGEAVRRDPDGALPIALSRLSATHCRVDDRDRIIDSFVALEAILLKGIEQELSFRQALRGATLLGGPKEERLRNFRTLKKAYSRRSKLVHGQPDLREPPTHVIVSLTRRIVRRFIEEARFENHDQVLEQLDERAVGGSE